MKDKYLLIIAILLGILAVVMVNRTISRYADQAVIPTTTMYQAFVDVPPGQTVGQAIDAGYLRAVRDIPLQFANGYMLALKERDIDQYVGMQIHRRIPAWEYLHAHHLRASSAKEVKRDVPSGMRLLSIQTSQIASTGYFVQPGEFVDLYQIREATGGTGPGGRGREAVVVARGVQVFSVDARWNTQDRDVAEEIGMMSARGVPYSIVTVAVPQGLLSELMVAREEGMLTMIPAEGATAGDKSPGKDG